MTGALYTHHEGHTHGIYTITSYRGHVAAAVHHLYVCPQVRLTALLQLRLEGSGARTHTLSLSYGHAHTHTRTYTAVGQIKRFLPVTEADSALREETRPSVCVRSRLGSVRLGPVRTVISGVCPGAAAVCAAEGENPQRRSCAQFFCGLNQTVKLKHTPETSGHSLQNKSTDISQCKPGGLTLTLT